ncbi:hypothetical protein MASR1M66_24740 [Aminivibrio sp.]
MEENLRNNAQVIDSAKFDGLQGLDRNRVEELTVCCRKERDKGFSYQKQH